jgi:hypothetical protein
MTYEMSWTQEGRIAHAKIVDSISIQELEAYGQTLIDNYLERGQAPVHIISDARQMIHFPTNILKVKQLTQSWLKHPNMGWAIVVGKSNPMLNFLAAVVTQVISVKYRMVATPEEALAILRSFDPSLIVVES